MSVRRTGHPLYTTVDGVTIADVSQTHSGEVEDTDPIDVTSVAGGVTPTQSDVLWPGMGSLTRMGIKLRGVQPFPQMGDPSYQEFWDINYDEAWLSQQIEWALQVGANLVRVPDDPGAVIVHPELYSLSTHLARVELYLDMILEAGLFAYPNVGNGRGYLGGTPLTLSSQLEHAAAFAELCDGYPNVIGLDVRNEGWEIPGPPNTEAYITPLLDAIRGATTKSLGVSMSLGNDTNLLLTDWDFWLGTLGLTHIDIHPYYPDHTNLSYEVLAQVAALNPGVPIIIGEISDLDDGTTPAAAARMNAQRLLVEHPQVVGMIWAPLSDNSPVAPLGLFDPDTGDERTNLSYPFRTIPRRSQYAAVSPAPVIVANTAALTSSYAVVGDGIARLAPDDFDAQSEGDAQWRVTANIVAAYGGDIIDVEVRDLTTDDLLATAETSISGSAGVGVGGTTPDSASPAQDGVISGTVGGAVVAGHVGTNAIYISEFTSIGFRDVTFTYLTPATFEFWVKRGRSGVQEYVGGAWVSGVTQKDLLLFEFTSGNAIRALFYGVTHDLSAQGLYTLTGPTIADTAWHHVAFVHDATAGCKLFVDGALSASSSNNMGLFGAASPFALGGFSDAPFGFRGTIDEVRVSSSARYSSAFTPTTTPFVDDADTLILAHMESVAGATGAGVSDITRLATDWLHLPSDDAPRTLKLRARNQTAARGTVVNAQLERRVTTR